MTSGGLLSRPDDTPAYTVEEKYVNDNEKWVVNPIIESSVINDIFIKLDWHLSMTLDEIELNQFGIMVGLS
jgi:hypothetical protein